MKSIVIVPDGFCDDPLDAFNGRTPMQQAATPCLDALARDGIVGVTQTIPDGMVVGSDVANMAVMGYDPQRYYTGRGPLEALAMGITLEPSDVAFRCSLITTDGERILDHSSGNISNEEAHTLIALCREKLSTSYWSLYPGVGYRHLLVWHNGPAELVLTPPHDVVGEPMSAYLPEGDGAERIRGLIEDSLNLLYDHPVNRRRRDQGLNPGNTLWPWGAGRAPGMPSFLTTYGVTGAVVAAVDLVKGLGRAVGLETPTVPGATGYVHTDFAAKGAWALKMLERHDFVFVHIEAPDEAGHAGDPDAKVWTLEQIDRHVVGAIVNGLNGRPFRMLVMPDHATPVATRVHRGDPLPFLLFDSRRRNGSGHGTFDESAAESSRYRVDEAWRLMRILLDPEGRP